MSGNGFFYKDIMMKIRQKPAEQVWIAFQQEFNLSNRQLAQFQRYEELLSLRNKEFNLTAIRELSGIVRQHFIDSLELKNALDLTTITTICDIGTGAGFPALPLKILYPHLRVILIEVTKKKQLFLREIIDQLSLDHVEIYEHDWRTFIRTTEYSVDVFVTRAAIDELELCKAFRPACFYKNASIVYWVTDSWEPHKKITELNLIRKYMPYRLGHKKRQLVFLGFEH
jgi:16S rRNA (guanine(527)-N(7))-methyltransferase RsmG